ncbi:glycoside hydrolase family 57 [Magnetofaba australis]|uniref:Putative glycoside hydrolase family protein n=1 Tax=Magnetofaba australis IT-1 TaxID=1434232 RepID=A0A1Y2KBT9_9PROT|nr:glycoside hydrolase family 57 [Magnetofaba australis]OSM07279.1 putative glycoside hydrolase family protein [Magnetofaba australis IT-1]
MDAIHHALVLNLHQPSGNLEELLDQNSWEPREILYALDRIPRALEGQEDLARAHLALSGALLETLSNPEFQQRVYGVVDCGSLLWRFQNESLFRILGTGYYHPVLPLIPEADRDAQVARWRGIGQHLFWRTNFQGFWPPEMGFCMEMIPLLARHGYRYVLVDSNHVEAVTEMSWQELRYRPHIARHGDAEIIVVVRDRDLSDAQESGMELGWFDNELRQRTQWCDFPPLVTTATDGDNGGWFRNPEPEANFWGLYNALLSERRQEKTPITPTFIDDYLDQYGAHGEVKVNTGAWNTGWHHGHGFVQWTGSQTQRDALTRVAEVSQTLRDFQRKTAARAQEDAELARLLEEATWRLLRAETSCHFYWGEAWVERAYRDLDESVTQLQLARGHLLQHTL